MIFSYEDTGSSKQDGFSFDFTWFTPKKTAWGINDPKYNEPLTCNEISCNFSFARDYMYAKVLYIMQANTYTNCQRRYGVIDDATLSSLLLTSTEHLLGSHILLYLVTVVALCAAGGSLVAL